MPCTKSRANTNVMYATGGGQGMAIMGATSLGKDATATKMTLHSLRRVARRPM